MVAVAGLYAVGVVAGQHGDFGGAQTARRARRVERCRAVADHDDVAGDAHLAALAHAAQHVDRLDYCLAAGDTALGCLPGADADEDGIEAGVVQALEGDLVAQGDAVDEAHAGLPERLELTFEHVLGQPELGDAVAQHAAGLVVGVVDRHLVTGLRQEPGAAEAGRTGADHGHPAAGRGADLQGRRSVVTGGAVQGADGDRVVNVAAPADRFAVTRTHAAEDARERQLVAHDRRGARHVAFDDLGKVGRYVDVCRAGGGAGRLAVGVVIREVHLEVALALGAHALGVGMYDLAFGDLGRAGGHHLALAFDLDHAQPAGAPGGHALLVT